MEEPDFMGHAGDESHLLREIYRTHQLLISTFTRVVGMSASKLALLRLLAIEAPGELGITDIARTLEIDPAAVTRLVQEMEERRWVKRGIDSRDRRRALVRITGRGREKFLEVHERMHEMERMLGSRFEKGDIETAVRVLSEIRKALELFKREGFASPSAASGAR